MQSTHNEIPIATIYNKDVRYMRSTHCNIPVPTSAL
jgi:hypothetical protein